MRSFAIASLLVASLLHAPLAEGRSIPNIRFDHLTACVSDKDKSVKFLANVFGWRKIPDASQRKILGKANIDSQVNSADVEWVDADGFTLQLLGVAGGGGSRCDSVGFPSITFSATNLPKALKRFERTGFSAVKVRGDVSGTDGGISAPYFTWPSAMTRQIDVRLQSNSSKTTTQMTNVGRVTKPRVDRIALIVRDSEDAAKFFTNVLGMRRHPETVDLDGTTNKQSGGIHVVFVDANGIWLALVQPVGPGPLNAYLDTHGDGVIAELIVEVPRIADFYDLMASKNVALVNTSGAPVDPVEKAHILEPFRDKIAYFPSEATGGLTIEIVERGPTATSLLERRDRGWQQLREFAPH